MLKLYKPVILSKKQINKFYLITYTNFTVMKKIVSIVLNPSMTIANKVLLQVQVRKHSKELLQMGMKLLHLIGMVWFSGMPQNQLGTLAGTKAFGCEGAYFYMRW